SFFSISVGVSVMVTYSSYLSKQEDLPKSAFTIVTMNILISFLAGLAIFPAVFAFGLEPEAGPGLLFVVLLAVFNQIPFGAFVIFVCNTYICFFNVRNYRCSCHERRCIQAKQNNLDYRYTHICSGNSSRIIYRSISRRTNF